MLKLAWRNLWRNKRRTTITTASIFFAVFLAICMRGIKLGEWNTLLDSVLHSYSGYIQLHCAGYWDNKTFDYSMEEKNPLLLKIEVLPDVSALVPRLESFSLASSGEKTKGVITVGIDPVREDSFSQLKRKIVAGKYFHSGDNGVILSQRLSKFLKLNVNDSIVLLSQGYQGMSASGIYKIIGIVKLPAPEFDNQMVFMPLPVAQDFYSAEGRISSWVIDLKDPRKMDKVFHQVQELILGQGLEVMTWKEMLIELYQQYLSNQGSSMIIISLLYFIVGFGIFGTVLMMIAERRFEFGIMITLGMHRGRLMWLVGMELLFVCLLGLISGFVFSLPIVTYFHFHPILFTGETAKAFAAFGMEPAVPMALQLDYMIQQVYIIFFLVAAVLIYPLFSLYKLNISAIRR